MYSMENLWWGLTLIKPNNQHVYLGFENHEQGVITWN